MLSVGVSLMRNMFADPLFFSIVLLDREASGEARKLVRLSVREIKMKEEK